MLLLVVVWLMEDLLLLCYVCNVSTVLRESTWKIKSKRMVKELWLMRRKQSLVVHWLQYTNQWNTEKGKMLGWSLMKKTHSEKGDPVFGIDRPFASNCNRYTCSNSSSRTVHILLRLGIKDYWNGVCHFFRSLFLHLMRWIQKYTM